MKSFKFLPTVARKVGFTLLYLFPSLISLCGVCTCLCDTNANADSNAL